MRRLTSLVTAGVLASMLVLHASGIATAGHGTEPDGDSETVAGLVAAVAEANQQFADLAADIQDKQESVNRVLVELASAREAVSEANRRLGDSEKALADSQTERANRLSAAKQARLGADAAAAEAHRRQDGAVADLVAVQRAFTDQESNLTRLAAERDSAQIRLAAARPLAAATHQPTAAQPSANVAGDPIAIINAVLKIMATSLQLTAEMGRNFLINLGILSPATAAADPGITNGRIPRLHGRQASEFVIRRAMSQLSVPYSWGGGNANGPSRGIDQGANTVGFDCSGLMLYAFAGVGIKLDHYSGSQYNAGRKVPSSQMQRVDLIFYGPNASQHEAMYLGDGMMLEAPYTGSMVKISPVRISGMTPYVTRLIEY